MARLKKHNPAHTVQPFAAYSQGVEVPPGARWLFIAGQVGQRADGTIPPDSPTQVEIAWNNVLAVLESAAMGAEDLVHVHVFITDAADVTLNRDYWKKISRNGGPGITMVTVRRLSHPDWKVEVQAVAAKV